MKAFPSSLRSRLSLVVLLAVIPLAALLVYNALRDREAADDQVREDVQLLVHQSVVRQEQLIEASRQIMASLAGLVASVDISSLSPERCNASFQLLLSDLTFYQNVGLAGSNGDILCSADPVDGSVNVAGAEWFRSATSENQFALGVYESDGITTGPTLSFGYAIRGPTGQGSAVLFLTLDIARLNELAAAEVPVSDATLTLRDATGTIIVSYPDQSRVGQPSSASLRTEGVEAVTDPDGVERLRAFTLVGEDSGRGLYASVSLPRSTGYAAANAELQRNLIVLAVVIVLALLVTYFVSDRLIVGPVRDLIGLTKRVSAGELDARAEVHGSGELSALGLALNEMAAALETRIQQREEAESRLRDANGRLQRTIAELKRSNADLEQFAYVASHDLQEPLRMVSSYTQLLANRYRDRLDQDANDFIDFAVDGAHRMQALINDLLEFSRVGTTGFPFAPVDMNAVVKRLEADLQLRLEETGALLTYDDLPEVHGDEIQLQQLLQNLISNSLKFRSDATPKIHISAEEHDGGWRFTVEDNGIGIPADQAQRIFVIFQRLHSRERYAGNGIGLSISKRIVERHGGAIWAEPRPGGGSVFSFTLQEAAARDSTGPSLTRLDVA
jgi:signal transduction histidine kinase